MTLSLPTGAGPRRGTRTRTPVLLFGARGMLAGELVRLLEAHPGLELAAAVSRDADARPHHHLPGGLGLCAQDAALDRLVELVDAGERPAVVLALPHGESVALWLLLRERLGDAAERLVVVDLAADFRLRDPSLWRAAYGTPHPAPDELAGFAYGLPELFRDELAGARRIAAPGCFATAMQLAAVPAARAGILDAARPWVLHGVTGSSGSGNEPRPTTHHPHRHDNLWAYAAGGHRHEAELAQALTRGHGTTGTGKAPELHLVACSGPFARGIHLSAALPLARAVTPAEAHAVFAEAYRDEPFVEVLEEAAPELRLVVGSNRAQVAARPRGGVLHVLVALDNLIKGGAGQALQALNVALGLPEPTGLPRAGLGVS